MDNKPKPSKSAQINLGREQLRTFFISHLNKVYAAKAHLVAQLPQIELNVHFSDLRYAIRETVEDVEKQMARMELVFALLDTVMEKANHNGLVGLVNDSFEDIRLHSNQPELRDMSILFYLQNIESMEMASFQVLEIAAVKLKNKQVKQLIKENYDEAKADRTLLLLITAKYLTS